MEIKKIIESVGKDGRKVLSNILNKNTGRYLEYKEVEGVTDQDVLDGKNSDLWDVYIKYKDGKYYIMSEYLDKGKLFLEKDSIAEVRAMSTSEILLLKIGYYKGVRVNGYYEKGDTPAPIIYDIDNQYIGSYNNITRVKILNGICAIHNFNYECDVRYLGLIEHNSGSGDTNINILKEVLSIENSNVGYPDSLVFNSGSKYYFSGFINFIRRGISINLNNSELNFYKIGEPSDQNKAFIRTLGDFNIYGGKVNVEYSRTAGLSGYTGAFIYAGARFKEERDGLPIRNFVIKDIDVNLNSNAPFICGIGDSDNINIDNINMDGKSVANTFIQYEWGFYTDEQGNINRTTTHASNISIVNIDIKNQDQLYTRQPIIVRGAYNSYFNNLSFTNTYGTLDVSPGEAAYYKPKDNYKKKGSALITNIIGENIRGVAFSIASHVGPGSYTYDSGLLKDDQLINLHSHTIINSYINGGEGATFCISGTSSNLILNGIKVNGFLKGIYIGSESRYMNVSNVIMDNIKEECIRLYDTNPTVPVKFRQGVIHNCYFSKSPDSETSSTIRMSQIEGFSIKENVFIGTHYRAIQLDPTCWFVKIYDNRVEDITDLAYVMGTNSNRRNRLSNNLGTDTNSGAWGVGIGNKRGNTASTPTYAEIGDVYYNSTIKKPLYWDGSTWLDSTGTAV